MKVNTENLKNVVDVMNTGKWKNIGKCTLGIVLTYVGLKAAVSGAYHWGIDEGVSKTTQYILDHKDDDELKIGNT